jgi:hypothetical protein
VVQVVQAQAVVYLAVGVVEMGVLGVLAGVEGAVMVVMGEPGTTPTPRYCTRATPPPPLATGGARRRGTSSSGGLRAVLTSRATDVTWEPGNLGT